jgi:3-oxoacyl-[acyl-carrier-protein] synthase III
MRLAPGSPRIVAFAGYAPSTVRTNVDLERVVDTSDEWIVQRTGIRERRIAEAGEATSDLAAIAGARALDRSGLDPSDIDTVIVGTCTPDHPLPSTASIVCERLQLPAAGSFDVSAACASYGYVLAQGHALVSSGLARNALVIGADVMSGLMDWSDRTTCVLFGDGAGAAVITSRPGPGADGVLAVDSGTKPDLDALLVPAGGSRRPLGRDDGADTDPYLRMNGREVFRFASTTIVESVDRLLERGGVQASDIDLFVPHQANLRIVEHAVSKTGIPMERVMTNLDRYGNTSSGSIPLALAEADEAGRLDPGSLVLTIGFGGGLTWAGVLFRYGGATA